jgi:hypothetical protein
MKSYSTICKVCGKRVRLHAPTGNWLDSLYPYRHFPNGTICDGSFIEVKTEDMIEPDEGKFAKRKP